MSEESNQLTETNVTINTSVDSTPAKRKRSPSLKRAATKAQKESTRGFPLPLLLTCPVTGKINKYTSLTYIRKLLAKHGTVEDLRKNYISAEGRKLQANKQ